MTAKLLGFLDREAIVTEIEASDRSDVIRELVRIAVARGFVDAKNEKAVLDAVLERENRGTTGLGDGLAVPHVKESPFVKQLCGAFGRSKHGIDFHAVDGKKVNLVFLILGAKGTNNEHIAILRKLASLRQNEAHFFRFLREAKDREAIANVLEEMAVA